MDDAADAELHLPPEELRALTARWAEQAELLTRTAALLAAAPVDGLPGPALPAARVFLQDWAALVEALARDAERRVDGLGRFADEVRTTDRAVAARLMALGGTAA